MRKFIQRLLIFFIILACILAPLMLYRIGGQRLKYVDNPTSSMIDKHARLDSLSSPRLIIVGGSNAFYGMNSARLTDSLRMNVVNMALFGGFGIEVMLNELKGKLRAGDVVLLSIEYFLTDTCYAREDILKYYPEAQQYMTGEHMPFWKPYMNTLKLNIESVENVLLGPLKKSGSIFVHSRTMNEFGDAVGYLHYKNPGYVHADRMRYRYYEGIHRINNFTTYAHSRGAKVYFVFPPFPQSDFAMNSDIIDHYHTDMRKHMQVPLLCAPEEMVLNDTMFFDSYYHLNRVGREVRTSRLIGMLKKQMD